MKRLFILSLGILLFLSCGQQKENEKNIPSVGFLDITEDETLAKARTGFFDALSKNGYSEAKKTLKVFKANGNGDIPTLSQSCDYLLSKNLDVLATNTTLSTVTAVQRTTRIPICMMVSPRPDIAGLTDIAGKAPVNLFGVYETLDYIDTAVTIIKKIFPSAKLIGTIYNQSEPQSRDAFARLSSAAKKEGMTIVSLPVNNSAETQLVTQALLSKKPDVFFALPDNVIFGSFETVVQSCNAAMVPVFTSEAGLVSRGALASFGADFYQWGFQAGEQTALFLKTKNITGLLPEIVKIRHKMYNKKAALLFSVKPDSSFVAAD